VVQKTPTTTSKEQKNKSQQLTKKQSMPSHNQLSPTSAAATEHQTGLETSDIKVVHGKPLQQLTKRTQKSLCSCQRRR
jgi:hypothetical protein